LTQRHSILRSTFHENTSVHPQPFIAETDPLSVCPIIETMVQPTAAIDSAVVNNLLHRAVDLSAQYAVRWVVVISLNSIALYLVSHHIALDGTSMAILASEFLDILDKRYPAETLSSSQTDVAMVIQPFSQAHLLERAYLSSDVFKAAEEFWLSQIEDTSLFKWRDVPTMVSSPNYREMQTWGTFTKKVSSIQATYCRKPVSYIL
jgi:hypothetical protein